MWQVSSIGPECCKSKLRLTNERRSRICRGERRNSKHRSIKTNMRHCASSISSFWITLAKVYCIGSILRNANASQQADHFWGCFDNFWVVSASQQIINFLGTSNDTVLVVEKGACCSVSFSFWLLSVLVELKELCWSDQSFKQTLLTSLTV